MAGKSNQVGLRVAVKFSTQQATKDLERVLNALDKKFSNKNWLTLDTKQLTEMTEAMRELANIKINIKGQKESLAYYESVTKQLEKQVKASEKIMKNMKASGSKELAKQEATTQKSYYQEAEKLISSIVKSEKESLSLTGENKKKMKEVIKDKKQQLKDLEKLIKHEEYRNLLSQKRKEMESEIRSEKIKQNELDKKSREHKAETIAAKEKKERLANAKREYDRLVEIKTKLYRLDASDPAIPGLKEELKHVNSLIRGYKRANDSKVELDQLKRGAELQYKRNIGLIDDQVIQTQDKQSKAETKSYIDSIAKQIKDIHKEFFKINDADIQQNLAAKLVQLQQELDIYREQAEWKKTIAKLDREIETVQVVSASKAADKEVEQNNQNQQQINNAWSSQFYTQYRNNLTERANLEMKMRKELVETAGVRADSIRFSETEIELLAQQEGYLGALAQSWLEVNKKAEEHAELIAQATYKNVVKDYGVGELQNKNDRRQNEQQEKLLQKQIEEAKTAQETIPLQQRLLDLQVEELLMSEHLTEEQRERLALIKDEIGALSGNTKAEVSSNASKLKSDIDYIKKLNNLQEERYKKNQELENQAYKAENFARKSQNEIKKLEQSGLIQYVTKEQLDLLQQLSSYSGLSVKEMSAQYERFGEVLKSVRLDANELKEVDDKKAETEALTQYIETEKQGLRTKMLSLDTDKAKKHLSKEILDDLNKRIEALNGLNKAEVAGSVKSIQKDIDYHLKSSNLAESNLQADELRKELVRIGLQEEENARREIESLENSKLALHLDKERLATLKEMATAFSGFETKAQLDTARSQFYHGLDGVKHDANIAYSKEQAQNKESDLRSYIEQQKEVLRKNAEILNSEKLQGFVLKDNYEEILKQIDALDGSNKKEVKSLANGIQKNIQLEETNALISRQDAINDKALADETEAYYLGRDAALQESKEIERRMSNKINELTIGKQLTAEQEAQIANLKEIRDLVANGQFYSMDDLNGLNQLFKNEMANYNSQTKQANQLAVSQQEVVLANQLLDRNKRNLHYKLEMLEVSKNGKYVDQEKLRIAKEMINALQGQTREQVRLNTQPITDYINTLTQEANISRIRQTGNVVNALGGSLGTLTRYFSGYMLVSRFFGEFKKGLEVVKVLDETLTTLRITLTNFTEGELSDLMEASKGLAVELKTSFTDVMNVIKTVANETESMATIMAKSRPALMLSNLTGLGTDQTVEMIQGVTRQYQSQFEALGLTAEEQGMKVADVMVAISRALGMDFSTGVAGMAEGIEIMGALSNELQMSVEETMALMAATSEQTRLTFSEIANAFKTTMARTIRISGTEEEISDEDLAKTEKALLGVGVQVRDFITGELRSFIDIMDDLADKWGDLTDSQRGAIGDALGGARQISTIMASINVTNRRQELTKIAEESAGAAQVAQDTWSNSLEAKLKELSNAGAMFWQTFIDSESYHTFLESMTSLVNILTTVVDFFGSVPFVITTALTSFGLFNKGARDLITGLIFDAKRYIAIKKGQNIVDQQGVAVTLDSVKADTAKRIGLQSLTFEAIKAKVAAIALQGALTFGVPVVFGLIVKGIQSIINSAKEAKEAVSNLSQTLDTYDSNKESAEASRELIDEYKSLKTSLKDITRGTDEYAKALERLCEIEDELSNKSERFKSVLNDTALGQEEKIQMLEFYAKQDLINAAQTADEELAGWWSRNSTMNTVTKEAEEFEKERAKYKALVRKSNSEAARVYKKALKQGATEEEALAKATEAQEAVNADLLEAEKRMITRVDSIQGLYDYMRRHNNQVSISEELLGESQSHKFSEKFFDYEGVVKETDELIKARNKDTKAIDKNVDSMKKAKKAVSEYKEKLKDLKSTYSEGRDSFVDETEKLQALKDLMDDINENGMTLDNFDHELLDDFKGNIADAAAVQAYLTEQIKLTEKAQGEAYGAMIENSEELFDSEVKNSEGYKTYLANVESSAQDIVSTLRAEGLDDLADHYADKIDMAKKDLQNSKSIAQSRAILEENLINGLQGAWFEYYEKVSDWELDYGNGLNPDGTYNEVAYEAWLKIQAYKKQLEEIANKIGQKIEITPPTITKPSSSSSSSSDKVDDLDLEIDRYHELNRAIQRINNALEKNKIAQENATPTKKLQLMKEEIELYKELREAQKALYAEQKKEASELKKKLSKNGFTFNDDGTVKNYKKRLEELEKQANKLSGDAKKAKIEEVKAIKDLVDAYEELINETIPETQQEYWELSNTIKEAQREQLEFVADLQSQLTDAITEELEKRYDATRKALEKEQELYNKQHEQEQWEDDYKKEVEKLAEIQAQVDALSRDFSESGRKKLEELLQQLQEQQEVVDQMWDDKLHEEANDRFDEALDELDKELEDALDAKNLAQMVDQALTNGFIKLDGEIIKTENLLTAMLENSGDLFLATGQLIKTELIDGLKVAQGLMSDISSLTSAITGRSRSIELSSTYGLTPTLTTASIDTASLSSRASSINVSFDQLLNVEGNLDTTLMLDLENKLRQAMNEVTYSISQALTYR